MKTIHNFFHRFTVSVTLLCALAVGIACGVAYGPVHGILGACAAIVVMAIPQLPFSISFNLGILPELLSKMISGNAEISGEELAKMFSDLRANINAMLSGLPPVEQFEAAPELVYGLRTMRSAAAQLLEIQDALGNAMQKYASQIQAKAESNAETKLLAKGEYVKKTDAETARDQAVNAAKEEVRTEINTESEAKQKASSARTKLVTDKVLSQSAADALPEEFFKAEGYDDRLVKLKARLKTLADNKLVNEQSEPFVAEMVALPLDEAGDKLFEGRINSVKSLVGAKASRGTEPKPPFTPPATGGGEGEAPKVRVAF